MRLGERDYVGEYYFFVCVYTYNLSWRSRFSLLCVSSRVWLCVSLHVPVRVLYYLPEPDGLHVS